jgi:hypothetical protein
MSNFPKNPKTGDIVTIEDGLIYVYDGTLNIWHQQEGGTISLATPSSSGLMSASDFKKLNSLVVPPPQSTITVADYGYSFTNGTIALIEGDDFINIDNSAKISDVSSISRQIHQNTYGFDFTIDTSNFFQYMLDSGRFTVVSPQGATGPKGVTGPSGKDGLTYGPTGATGPSGANAAFDLTIQSEPASLKRVDTSVTRAVTSITTEEISESENYLVVTRSIIGNPDACPSQLKLSSATSSTWLVALPTSTSQATITWLPDSCHTNSQSIYYIDISGILSSIEDEFNREVASIKNDCENIVQFWLSIMAGLFDEQKAALCCALEYCQSQSRNVETRQYIEQQRIQAAQAVTLKGSTSTTYATTDTAGNPVTVTNQSINSTAQSIVIDGNPLQSGKSVVNTTVMDNACGDGFGANNIHNLPNNSDPVGGTSCVPGIVMSSDGTAYKYDECPPGFIPRYVSRDVVLTSETVIPVTASVVDYTAESDVPETGSGSSSYEGVLHGKLTPGVALYLPPGVSLARIKAINCYRSNNPETSASLRVTVTGSPLSICQNVTVYVKSSAGVTLAYGKTNGDGDIYFKNLSSLETYTISLEKTGYIFAPEKWTSIAPTVLTITQLQSSILTGVTGTAVQQIVKCSSGSNILVVTVAGDDAAINLTWVSIRYYTTGYTLCSAYAGTSTTNVGEIVFTGIPDGLWVVYAGTDDTLDTDPYYYVVDQPCNPVANPISQQAIELRSCTTVQFTKRSDGRQNLSRMTFVVLTKTKPASSLTLASSVPAELVSPGDARFEELVKQQIISDPDPKVTLSEALSAFDNKEPVALKIESDAEFKIYYTTAFGTYYDEKSNAMLHNDSGFFDKLFNGVHNICIVNKTGKSSKFRLKSATRNIKFLQGAGNGWSNTLIRSDDEIFSENGPTEAWWLQIRVEHPDILKHPYSMNCGSIGPRSSKTDKRFCRELPNGTGSIITRDFVVGDGSISEWLSSRCGTKQVPDAIEMTVGSPFTIDNLILCRVSHNAYSGGFNFDGPEKRSAQIIVEQLDPAGSHNNNIGGTSYRCTILGWNSSDCIDDVSNFGSVIVNANCDRWSIEGSWTIGNIEVKFSANEVANLLQEEKTELVLNVDESNQGFFKGANAELSRGSYVVDIVDCCFRSGEQYTGHIEIEYQSVNGKTTKRFPNLGSYTDLDSASSNYRGLTIEIDHQGGTVCAKLVAPVLLDGSGKISVRFTAKGSFVQDDLKTLLPKDSCAISYAQVKIMEEWYLSQNEHIIADVAGQDYIIINHHIDGIQACTEKYNNPSFAWPTLDGRHFIGVPSSGIVIFKYVPQLEAIAKAAIKNVDIGIILFPVIMI